MTLKAEWIDGKREPTCAPDPLFPNGIDVDASQGAARTCSIDLPYYPAPRCGTYMVTCDTCGLCVGMTTAGRPDDPRKLTLGCFANQMEPHPGLTEIVPPNSPRIIRTPHP